MNESALERLKQEVREKEIEKKTEVFRKEHIEKKRTEQVRLTREIYVEPLASCTPTTKEIKVFEQKLKSKELEEELEKTLNFLKKPTIFIAKPTPHVIVISNSKEEVEIRPQPIIEEQL